MPFDGLLPAGTILRKTYVIEDVIGEGGMGVVYKAHHHKLGSTFAIKVLDSKLARISTLRDRFLEEARIQATIQHPNIVRVLDILDEDGVFGMVMQYIEGRTLDAYIHDECGQLTFPEARAITTVLLEAIDHAHQSGVIHRDLKPSNVLLTTGHNPSAIGTSLKVLDFGIAKILDANNGRTITGAKMGTPRYMAPEQVRNARDVDARADVYAIGLTLYEMVCGRSPYEELRDFDLLQAQIDTAPPPPSKYREDIPAELEAVILKSLEKDPDDRYSNAKEFMRALDGLEVLPDTVPPKPEKQREAKPSKHRKPEKPGADAPPKAGEKKPRSPKRELSPAAEEPDENWELGDTNAALRAKESTESESRGRSWVAIVVVLAILGLGGLAYRSFGPPGQKDRKTQQPLTEEQVKGKPHNTDSNVMGLTNSVRVETLKTDVGRMSLVAAGTYWVGSLPDDPLAGSSEAPASAVELKGFFVDQTEVSVFYYAQCADQGSCPPLPDLETSVKTHPNTPVTGVGFGSAEAFCSWAGKRLPSEEEWDAAARAGRASLYPTMDEPTCAIVNFGTGSGGDCVGANPLNAEGVYGRELGKNPLHLRHMAGNVWEWTRTQGPDAQERIVKGGSWKSRKVNLRVSARRVMRANTGDDDVGFRCVKDRP